MNIGSIFGNRWDNNIKSADPIPVLENGSQARTPDGKITEWTQPDQQSLGTAIDKDVRDAINAGAIPGPRLLTSISPDH